MTGIRILGCTAAVTAALAVLSPAVGHADEPSAGAGCDSSQLNLTTVSSAGEGLRCLADNLRGYVWQRDDGTTQSPSEAERIARNACGKLPHGAKAECRSLLDHPSGG